MDAYLNSLPSKIEYSVSVSPLDEFDTSLQKQIKISGALSTNIDFYRDKKFQKMKYVIIYLENKKKVPINDNKSSIWYPSKIFKSENPNAIAACFYLSHEEMDHFYNLLIQQKRKIHISMQYDFPNMCHLLFRRHLQLNSKIPDLEYPSYVLTPEALYFLPDINQNITQNNLISLDKSNITIEDLWKELGYGGSSTPCDADDHLSHDKYLIIQKTGHRINENISRRIQNNR